MPLDNTGRIMANLLLAVPYGLGAGGVDAALSNCVAIHYASRHMSWLHAMWGLGTLLGPYIMASALGAGHGWAWGYRTISILQVVLTAVLVLSLPLWKARKTVEPQRTSETSSVQSAQSEQSEGKRLTGASRLVFAVCSPSVAPARSS